MKNLLLLDNLEGLQFIREHVRSKVNIAAGEYGYNLPYFDHMLKANAVDILQADATRCGGISYFIKAGYLAEALPNCLSLHIVRQHCICMQRLALP